jgi:antitoxin component of MazEF toxin-antitoxin module
MTITVKTSDEDTISIPAQLMAELNLREGDEVQVIVEGETLQLKRLDKFLQLRGALADDPDFDRAMEQMERAWQAWTTSLSVRMPTSASKMSLSRPSASNAGCLY